MEIVSSRRYSIKQIFKDHWHQYLEKNKDSVPLYVQTTVKKMLSCRNPESLGYHKYACPEHPEQFITVPHSCKSRFCTTCSKTLTDQWVAKAESCFPDTSFHHICFTIPDSLRQLLDEYRFLLNCLFTASSQTMLSWAHEQSFLPAVICVIHSFGRDLKSNPHIHMLISSGGLSLKTKKQNKWKHCSFIPFKMLHKRWRFLLIATLKNTITKYLKNNPDCGELAIFSNPSILHAFFAPFLSRNWYVHDSKELEPQNFSLSYLARYSKRPPLAERRLLYYDKISGQDGIYVTFSYKESGKPPVLFTVPVEKFISLLIQHILPPNFRQVRFYGALANRVKSHYQKLIGKALQKVRQTTSLSKWRERQKLLTGQDPLICPICGKTKILVEVAFFSKKTTTLSVKTIPP